LKNVCRCPLPEPDTILAARKDRRKNVDTADLHVIADTTDWHASRTARRAVAAWDIRRVRDGVPVARVVREADGTCLMTGPDGESRHPNVTEAYRDVVARSSSRVLH
jgi:hypothetical protein